MGIHWQELIVILLIVLVLFGPKRLPEIGSSLGKGIRGFKESVSGMVSDDKPTAATLTAASTSSTTTEPAVPVPVEVVVDTDEPHDSAR